MATPTRTASRPRAQAALEICLYEEIESWSVRPIVERLQAAPDADVTIRINSPGGDPHAAFALCSNLRTHRGRKVAVVEGVAASAATFVLCACDEVQMHPESFVMVHNPWGGTTGTAADLEEYAQSLRQIEVLMVSMYTRRTGKDEATVRKWMSKDTWMTPSEALEAGLCDSVIADAPAPSARASAARFAARLRLPIRPPTAAKYTRNNMEEIRDKLAKYGLAEDDSNLPEALTAYLAETEDGPAERKEMCKAVEEMKSAKAEDDEDEKEDEDKGEKAMSRVTSAMARQLAEADSERKALAKQVAALEKERADREVGEVVADAKSRGLTEADAREFYKDFGKAGAMRWLAKFPRKVSALGKWDLGGGVVPAEGSAVEKVNGVNVIGRGLAKAAAQLLKAGEAKTLGEAQILAAKRNPHLYQTAE